MTYSNNYKKRFITTPTERR